MGNERLKRERLHILWLSGICHRRWTQLKLIWRAGLTSCQHNERERERERGTSRKQRERERKRERERVSEVESRTETSTSRQRIELWWSRPTAFRSPSSGILHRHRTSRPVWPVSLPLGTLHAPGQQPTPWLSPAGSLSSSNITRRWVSTVAFFCFSSNLSSSFTLWSGVHSPLC